MYEVINNIIRNGKRMDKLASLPGSARRDKAKAFVIGEAAALHIRLTEEEIRKATAKIVAAVGKGGAA